MTIHTHFDALFANVCFDLNQESTKKGSITLDGALKGCPNSVNKTSILTISINHNLEIQLHVR